MFCVATSMRRGSRVWLPSSTRTTSLCSWTWRNSRTPMATDPAAIGVLLFRHVQEQSEVVRVLLGSHTLLPRLIEVATQNIVSDHTPRPCSVVPLEIAAYHMVTSTISLIQWWLEHEMPYSPEQMGTIYHELIARPTSEVAFYC